MKRPILALDFDGCCHAYSRGWQDGSIYDPPVPGLFEWLEQAQKAFTVIIYSSRSREATGTSAMAAWFVKHAELWRSANGRAEFLLNIAFAHEKPAAFLTIDDRAVRFDGDWSANKLRPQELLKFKPWMQRVN